MINNNGLAALAALSAAALLAGCSIFSPQEREPRPAAAQPHEAFEQVGDPQVVEPGPGPADPDGLSSDIERLQDARRKYDHDKSQEARELRRRQQNCAANPDSSQVPIQGVDGKKSSFCQSVHE